MVAPTTSGHSYWESSINTAPHPSFTEMEVFTKKELPGKRILPMTIYLFIYDLLFKYLLLINWCYLTFIMVAVCVTFREYLHVEKNSSKLRNNIFWLFKSSCLSLNSFIYLV